MSMSSRKARVVSPVARLLTPFAQKGTASTARSRKQPENSEGQAERRSSNDVRDSHPVAVHRGSECITSDAPAEARGERRPSKQSGDAPAETRSERRPSKQSGDAPTETRNERRPSKRLSLSSAQAVESSIRVVVRVRPRLPTETEKDGVKVVAGGRTLVLSNGQEQRQFGVDAVFDSRTENGSQTVVFDQFGKDLVDQSLKGYNVCIFAYGHTGSGKTYTMLGDAWGFPSEAEACFQGAGLLPRFLWEIFQAHAQDPRLKGMHYSCEFYEVYNDQIRDLLAPNNAERKRKVHVHPKHGVRIEGSSPSLVNSAEEALGLLIFGNQMRTVASTTMNERSSRSHAIISFKFVQMGQDSSGASDATADAVQAGISPIPIESTATFVDLAGREDQGASNNKAMQFREMCFINTSLFHLAHLITKLAEGQVEKASLTDFRNSKLTLLLSQALIGNSRTALVATVAPLQSYFEESVSTMVFAQSVRKIQTVAIVNNKGSGGVVAELEAEVRSLRKELEGSKTNASEKEIGLLAAEALIDYYKRSYEEALSRSQEMKDARSRFSMRLGLSDPALCSPAKSQVLDLFPFFTKLSDDPSLQGCCNYLVNKETLRIGSSEQSCDIVLRGLGIASQMCEVRQNLADGGVYVEVSNMVVNGSGPRVLVNGVPVTADVTPRRMEHGDSIILGYAHAFRLVKPTRCQVAEVGTDNPGVLARSTIPKLDMASAVAEIEEENGVQFKEVYPFLQQLSSHAPESTVASFLKALHCICPLIDEANLITREVFGGEEMRFQLYTLADPFRNLRCDVPEFAVCLLQTPRPPGKQLGQGPAASAPEHRGIFENDMQQDDSEGTPGKARWPLLHALGLGDHMMVDGQELLYVWSLEKFLRRLNEIREIYQEGSEARDSFAGVWQRLSKNPFLNPWTELRFADLKLFAVDIGHILRRLTVDEPIMSWITCGLDAVPGMQSSAPSEAAPQTPPGVSRLQTPLGDRVQTPLGDRVQTPRGERVQTPRGDRVQTPQGGFAGTPGTCPDSQVPRWLAGSVPAPEEVPKLKALCAANCGQSTSDSSNSQVVDKVSALQRQVFSKQMSARSLSSGGTSALPSARSMLRDEDTNSSPQTDAALSAAGFQGIPKFTFPVPPSPWDSAPVSARLDDSAPTSARVMPPPPDMAAARVIPPAEEVASARVVPPLAEMGETKTPDMGRIGSRSAVQPVPRLSLHSSDGDTPLRSSSVFVPGREVGRCEANAEPPVIAVARPTEAAHPRHSPRTSASMNEPEYPASASDRPLSSVKCDLDALRRRLADLITGNKTEGPRTIEPLTSQPLNDEVEARGLTLDEAMLVQSEPPGDTSMPVQNQPPEDTSMLVEDTSMLGGLSQEARLTELLNRFETMLARISTPTPNVLAHGAGAATPAAAVGNGIGQVSITWPVVPVFSQPGIRTLAWPSPSPGGSASMTVAHVRSPVGSRTASPGRAGFRSPMGSATPQVLPPGIARQSSPPLRATVRSSGSRSVGPPGQPYLCRSRTGSPMGRLTGVASVGPPPVTPLLVRRASPMVVSPPVSRATIGVPRASPRSAEERLDSGHITPYSSGCCSSASLAARAWNTSPRSTSNAGGASTPGSGNGVARSPRLAFSPASGRAPSETRRQLARSPNRTSGSSTPVRPSGRLSGRTSSFSTGFSTPAAGTSPTSPPVLHHSSPLQQFRSRSAAGSSPSSPPFQQSSPGAKLPGSAVAAPFGTTAGATAAGTSGHRWTAIPL